jgi:RNA polymerase sigma factor (sigma-70 family)
VRSFLSRVAGAEKADDLAQETFLQAWRRMSTYRGEGAIRAWLLRIAWTIFLQDVRKGKAVSRANIGVEDEVTHGPGVEAKIDLARALGRLTARERAVATLCLGWQHSHAEAADVLGLPLGTVKSTLRRAQTKLQNALKDSNDG